MAMGPTENVRSFFGRLNKVNAVILDAYNSYTLTPADPALTGQKTMSFLRQILQTTNKL
jgi:hypothetical protein